MERFFSEVANIMGWASVCFAVIMVSLQLALLLLLRSRRAHALGFPWWQEVWGALCMGAIPVAGLGTFAIVVRFDLGKGLLVSSVVTPPVATAVAMFCAYMVFRGHRSGRLARHWSYFWATVVVTLWILYLAPDQIEHYPAVFKTAVVLLWVPFLVLFPFIRDGRGAQEVKENRGSRGRTASR